MKKTRHKSPRKAKPATGNRPAVDAFSAALAAHQSGQLEAAENGYRAVLRQNAGHPHANNNLAILLRTTHREQEAVGYYRRALESTPDDPRIYNNLASLLTGLGRVQEAQALATSALVLRPDYFEAWFNLGTVLQGQGHTAAARLAYERVLRLKPDSAEAYNNLGLLHKKAGELSQATECFIQSIRSRVDLPHAFTNLGETLKEQGKVDEAIVAFQKGLDHHPTYAILHSNLLFALHYTPSVPPDIIHRAHLFWNERHARALLPAVPSFANDRTPARRLRVGYVSPDFCAHSCAYFSEPLLSAHDPAAVEIFCYSTSARHDTFTERFKALSQGWCPLTDLDDAAAAARIARDGIDILVDLAGHTAHSRPLVFARKPAPIQVTWLGYPDTTGMAAMDYRLTDAVADPVGATDRWHSETLIRLPQTFLTYQPLVSVPVAETPPALTNGGITFGSFNNIAKLGPGVVEVWAEILKQAPQARMIIKGAAFEDTPTRERYAKLFVLHGIASERIDLLARLEPVTNHLRAYDRIDIGLDPFPYNGTTTTCEALWMGVPVVTLAGATHVSRVGASLLTTCGLSECVATDRESYIAAAVALARDLPRLADLRRGMRARLESSPLADAQSFARAVEEAYRRMWHTWLARSAPVR